MIEMARKQLNIDLNIIIRPRGGDFLYTQTELKVMKKDILVAKKLGVDGVVIGLLSADGEINIRACEELIEIARPLNVTFHRAFDVCKNPIQALHTLIDLGIDRLLTSGQKNKAEDGLELISELVKIANDKIIIMPGSGINEMNFLKIKEGSKSREFHVSCRTAIESKMAFRKQEVKMGGVPDYDEYKQKYSDLNKLKSIMNQLNQ